MREHVVPGEHKSFTKCSCSRPGQKARRLPDPRLTSKRRQVLRKHPERRLASEAA